MQNELATLWNNNEQGERETKIFFVLLLAKYFLKRAVFARDILLSSKHLYLATAVLWPTGTYDWAGKPKLSLVWYAFCLVSAEYFLITPTPFFPVMTWKKEKIKQKID